MDDQTARHRGDLPAFLRQWGFWAVLAGAVSMVLVLAQIVGPSLEPGPSAASRIGEMAGEIRRSAWRALLGLPRETSQEVSVSLWSYLAVAAPLSGVVAVVLSVISGVLRENWRYRVYATGLGVAAITFQFFWWVALLVAGVVLLVAIIENMSDIFGA